jgi:hypothetical protein
MCTAFTWVGQGGSSIREKLKENIHLPEFICIASLGRRRPWRCLRTHQPQPRKATSERPLSTLSRYRRRLERTRRDSRSFGCRCRETGRLAGLVYIRKPRPGRCQKRGSVLRIHEVSRTTKAISRRTCRRCSWFVRTAWQQLHHHRSSCGR